ncbi:MAG: hypothetical protein RLZZ214_3991 [Verrucomicrobiota bacterium]|jgi:hypothetical protein
MSSRHSLILTVIASFGISFIDCAAKEGGNIILQFLSFPKAVDPKPVELVVGEGKTIKVEIPTNTLSKTYTVKRQDVWAVGATGVDEKGKPVFNVFGQAETLDSSKQLILLVRKGENNADGMDVIPIDNGTANFGGGKFLFMNATKVDISGEAGGVKFAIQPGKSTIIKPQAVSNDQASEEMFSFREGNEAKPFFSSKWPISDKSRSLIFFYNDPTSQRLRMHSIRDFIR